MIGSSRNWIALLLTLTTLTASAGARELAREDLARLRQALETMKQSPRGPFSRIRWFCADGTIHPPKPYACAERGGGVQHGEWSAAARELRQAGFPIATFYAELTSDELLADTADPDRIPLLLLEQFLIHRDDGWVLRQARFYRGAFQAEDEARGAWRLLHELAARADWRQRHYLLLREMVRLLPHNLDSPLLTRVRGLASNLARRDPDFIELRNKIHVRPEAQDAERVRQYRDRARRQPHAAAPTAQVTAQHARLLADYQRLSVLIEQAFTPNDLHTPLARLASQASDPSDRQRLRQLAQALSDSQDAEARLALCAELLAFLRTAVARESDAGTALAMLQLSLQLERHSFTSASPLVADLSGQSRAQQLGWLRLAAASLYGGGLLSAREWRSLQDSFAQLEQPQLPLARYRQLLHQLQRLPGWAQRRLAHAFEPAVQRLARLEPLAEQFIPDRLRASPTLFYAEILDTLLQDAQRLSQVNHRLFGQPVASGLRSLNPGLARGILSTAEELRDLPPDALGNRLYITPATELQLPPVAGVLTLSAGNELSHVQMLARDLGIPNVVVSEQRMQEILQHLGKPAVLLASPGGIVQLEPDGAQWDTLFGQPSQPPPTTPLRLDPDQLDLTPTLIPLHQLRAGDSGRRVGPKAAQLGELSHRFPGRVAPGLVLPFGVFHQQLQRPIEPGLAAADWLQQRYQTLAQLEPATPAAREYLSQTLARMRAWLQQQPLPAALREQLHQRMAELFGPAGSYGVFVRSDTNVEDLPGFSGAGLNLTLPHVVGFEPVVAGIKRVWAAAFSERAFAWRQRRLAHPEAVMVSVLLQQSVPVEKSGVLVTQDLESGARSGLSVAANAGVGGSVAGQAAESLRIDLETGRVRLLASATAPRKRVLNPDGGSRLIPAEAPDALLSPAEIEQLIALAHALPADYPGLQNAEGEPLPADIEFGFLDGQLWLFQLRPFQGSANARRSHVLSRLDHPLTQTAQQSIRLAEAPRGFVEP